MHPLSARGSLSSRTFRARRGAVLIYVVAAMTAFVGIVSLAVDLGHVRVAKNELQNAADAAARYGAAGLATNPTTAISNAVAAAANNTVDGASIAVSSSTDVALGTWSSTTNTFTVLTGSQRNNANAVKVTCVRTAARGNPISLTFAQFIGMSTCDVTASSIATYTAPAATAEWVPATSDPWLAGMPTGTISDPVNPHNDPDHAGTSLVPLQSPVQLSGATSLTANTNLTFTNASGSGTNDPNGNWVTAAGDSTWINTFIDGPEHGISNITAPMNALLGVFLGPTEPDLNTAPPSLDFSTAASRDFTTLAPQLQQVFYIGTGTNSSGQVQQFTVPQGATRLYIATMDGYEYSNNQGGYNITVTQPAVIKTVQ